ncbi:septal ring lytic transglycosylase RlpA family protein [Ideonella sp. B7]|uniref:septal ring lytic transglycosylase RlpA family protein n=1 Tax=Ideonella benzenivorans TaxID=2831643 RepID=UPI001CECF438|nr:septal ring lytic transglycosylase RlpA family protein [Ideonella benzenivorans]MCA6215228.1 septal ring lytic transglycosylase RlpA family protein [Ideonella benzenivorans]
MSTGHCEHLRRGRRPQRLTTGGLLLAVVLALAACSSTPRRDGPPPGGAVSGPDAVPRVDPIRVGGPNKPYTVLGRSYVPMTADLPLYEEGLASWYGTKFHGASTASGEPYNMNAMTAAHRTMPIPSYARVRNPANGREVIVRVNDRGPFVSGRVIDLSYAAAVKLGVQNGVAPVEVQRITHDEIRTGAWRTDAATALAAARPAAPAAAPVAVAPTPVPLPAPMTPGVADRRAETPTAADPAGAQAAGFWLQLGAFSRSDGADSFRRQVATTLSWLSPQQLAIFAEDGLHRLQAGPYASRQQASMVAERVRDALQLVPVIVERR